MGKRNTFLPYSVKFFSLLINLRTYLSIFSSLPALKRKTKRKGLPGAGSDSEEEPDGDSTGILGQRAARRAAAVQLEQVIPQVEVTQVSIYYFVNQLIEKLVFGEYKFASGTTIQVRTRFRD